MRIKIDKYRAIYTEKCFVFIKILADKLTYAIIVEIKKSNMDLFTAREIYV